MRFLLVEDNTDHAELVRATFEVHFADSSLEWVQDGEQALAFLRQEGEYAHSERPDAVLMDLWLPKLNGLQALDEIKADPALSSIPVVMLSSSESERDRVAASRHHADHYIVKPMDFAQLRDAVHHLQIGCTAGALR